MTRVAIGDLPRHVGAARAAADRRPAPARCALGGAADRQSPARIRDLGPLNAAGCAPSHGDAARKLLARTSLIELSPLVLQRALEPIPRAVRTLHPLHLASMHFLAKQRLRPRLASYEQRLVEAAHAMRIELFDLDRPTGRT